MLDLGIVPAIIEVVLAFVRLSVRLFNTTKLYSLCHLIPHDKKMLTTLVELRVGAPGFRSLFLQ
jgi:hypothetical protein